MKNFDNIATLFADEDRLDGDELTVLSITTKPCFSSRLEEWRGDGKTYERAWSFIADRIIEEVVPELECVIDDNYLRVFVHNETERDAVYESIEKHAVEIDEFFGVKH